ncbi:hypothetical protein DHEL01_v212894 [Diaporthe helianthi]|uniref:Uncharacterized protein n=1 Tax=Diaporthe helianthi TaxID=158607 RepID=A0A2P5HEN7_DIAHE|nr:hypothetical protein DHEL01_v212894 [Diaporthe helianthi]
MLSTASATGIYRSPDSSSGTITSWIPFATTYSPHPEDECASAFWQWNQSSQLVAWDPGYGISVNQNLRCVPEAVTTWWLQGLLGPNTETVVSIGPLTCPSAFSQVATHVEDETRTRVACCPSGYTFANLETFGVPGQCYSDVEAGATLTYQTSNERKEWAPTTLTVNTTTSVLAIHINGWIFAEETATSDSSQPNSTPSCPTDSRSLSTGDTVGIGVGVGLGVVGLATLTTGIFLMHHRPAQTSRGPHSELESHGGYNGSYGTRVGEIRYKVPPSELPSEES